ncbi:hypothetical protein [Corynebacterium sp.]|uniref:hypothetical protein n=1 Tax=Corynebacterium sp. TaxID=1720 RepID=UPI0025B95E2F|nr:hypothetical protein [Corynebacterium sp.]
MAEYDGTTFRNDDPDTPLEASVLNDWNSATVDHGKRLENVEGSALTSSSTLDMRQIGETTPHSRDVMRSETPEQTRDIIGAAAVSDIPDTSSYATQSDIDSAVDGLAAASDIPDISGLASQDSVDALSARLDALEAADGGESGE